MNASICYFSAGIQEGVARGDRLHREPAQVEAHRPIDGR